MRLKIRLIVSIILLFFIFGTSYGQLDEDKNQNAVKAGFVSLDGQVLPLGNPIEADGNIHKFNSPLIHLVRTKSKSPKGTILLLPDGGYELLDLKNGSEKVTRFLNTEGFDVALLEYHIGTNSQTRDLALIDALKAFRLLKASQESLGLCNDRLGIMGISSGGHLAARTVQKLGDNEQPNDLILISPTFLDETGYGTVFPVVSPPVQPTARLFTSFSVNDKKGWINSCEEYTKTWRGYDGLAFFHLLPDSVYISDKDRNPVDRKLKLAGLLKIFLDEKPEVSNSVQNPAAVPVKGSNFRRHAEKLALVAQEKFDLIMIGNSITNNFEKPEYQPVWNQFFARRKALNLGYSGYRTENILWNIQNGELDGQKPKVIVLEIGTNNVDEKNYPTRHTAGQLAGGIGVIVKLLREKLPDTKIIVLRCFPGCYGGPNPTSHRFILERASDIVSRLADGKHIFLDPYVTDDPTERHRQNWRSCIKSREKPVMSVELGFNVVILPIIANISYQLGRKLRWDSLAHRFIGDEEANRMLAQPYRAPYFL